MKPEELIEAEAEWLNRFAGEVRLVNPEEWNDWIKGEALAHFKVMNGWGVRMKDENQDRCAIIEDALGGTDADQYELDEALRGFLRVQPLPEAQTLTAVTFDQAIVELGKAHRTEAKE